MNQVVLAVCRFVIVFFLFACAGWVMEVTLKFLQFHRFINRGFLIGPYCPIYGWGAVAVTVLVGGLLGRRGTVGEVFLAGIFICGGLEYFTSWYMEKIFHARWWDYSQKPMNLHGRIWIGNLLLFGAASVVIVKWIDPLLFGWLEGWSAPALLATAIAILVLLAADNAVSHVLMDKVKKEIDTQEGDNTEEISRWVLALLKKGGYLLHRISDAYPNAQARSKRLVAQWQAARRKFKSADHTLARERKNAAKAALGKLKAMEVLSADAWKKRVEDALAKRENARKELHQSELKVFGHHSED